MLADIRWLKFELVCLLACLFVYSKTSFAFLAHRFSLLASLSARCLRHSLRLSSRARRPIKLHNCNSLLSSSPPLSSLLHRTSQQLTMIQRKTTTARGDQLSVALCQSSPPERITQIHPSSDSTIARQASSLAVTQFEVSARQLQ